MSNVVNEFKKKVAVVILAYADYESLELALASHAKFTTQAGVHIFVLQNGRGTYDCERTYAVGKRYHYLYPDIIDVVDDITPGPAYRSIKKLLSSEKFSEYDYVIKLDDDVLVLTEDWVDKLCELYIDQKKKVGNDLAYVSALVNNNPYGFKKIIENWSELSEEYFKKIARKHFVGSDRNDSYGPYRIMPKDQIYGGANGTIWRYPYIARWLHEKTTLVPEKYIEFASGLGVEEVNSKERYSINCMLFEKKLWEEIDDGGNDDEHMFQVYCIKKGKRIFADLSIPLVHLFFFVQRDECKDMIDSLREVYTNFLQLEFPIPLCNNRMIEIENRLRFMENTSKSSPIIAYDGSLLSKGRRKIKGGIQCYKDHGLVHTWRRTLYHLHLSDWKE